MQAAIAPDRSGSSNPGRWVGGLIGALVCLAIWFAAVAWIVDGSKSGAGIFSRSFLSMVGLGGLPIAVIGGRALLPAARSGGWLTAVAVGFGFGMIAPPLGGLEVIVFAMLPTSSSTSGFDDNVMGFLVLAPLVLMYSYVIAVLTVPAGLLWALIVRAIPDNGLDAVQAGTDAVGARLKHIL